MKTFSAKSESIQRKWYLIDAEGKTLGRLATEIARRLRGKNKPEYTPHADTGDFIVVINADKFHVTGQKLTDKMYHWYTGYPGGVKTFSLNKLLERKPTEPLKKAVQGMMPKGPLGRAMFKKLKIYSASTHPHQAQEPELLNI